MVMKTGLALALGVWTVGISSMAYALPVLDTKDEAVRINTSGKEMNINSTTPYNVIKWVDFSIAGGENPEKVTFDKHDYLNYVTGHATSEIFGTLTGGGNIYIINPNGILIGDGAEVNVGNLYLSTQKLSDAQLAAFRAYGTSPVLDAANADGNVVNLGHLEAKTVVVEGNVIKFKNVTDVDAPTINVFAKTETRVGCDGGTLPEGWRFFRSGTEGQVAPLKYKLINDEVDLQNITVNDANGRYMLAGNIEVDNDFTAIGTSSQPQEKFLGHFDGLGYEITFMKNIKANGKTSGFFGAIGEGSVVENVGVITSALGFSATGSFGDVFVGGVVGENYKGTIQNVWHSGNIQVEYSCSNLNVGGIVGCNTSGRIMSAYNTGDILVSGAKSPSAAYVGGIVGYHQTENNADKSLVEKAFNNGKVTAKEAAFAGGIVGGSRGGSVTNVYNLAPVSGQWAGGIVGKVFNSTASISYAYHALGDITGLAKAGAIAGGIEGNNCTTTHVFHVNANVHVKANEGTVTEVSELKKEGENWWQKSETFEKDGWSISPKGGESKTWRIYEGNSMPLLTAFLEPKDNINIVESDDTRLAGSYVLEDKPSVMVSGQCNVYEDEAGKKHYAQGYDYVSDVTCVLPKDEATETKPDDTGKSADTEKTIDTEKPIDAEQFDGTDKPIDIQKPVSTEKPSGSETVAANYPIGKEYLDTVAVLQHQEPEEQLATWAATENETEKLVVVGNGVYLPDSMNAEDLEAKLSKTEETEEK